MASDGAEIGDRDLLRKKDLTAGEIIHTCGGDSRDDLTVLVLTVVAADGQGKGVN